LPLTLLVIMNYELTATVKGFGLLRAVEINAYFKVLLTSDCGLN